MKRLILIVAGLLMGVSGAASAAPAAMGLPDFASLVAQYGPAVVNISTTQSITRPSASQGLDIPDLPPDSPLRDFLKHFLGQLPEHYDVNSLGSGFIISDDGYILTCAHVIENATEIVVRLTDRRELEAKVVGFDRRSDVGLLKIKATGLPVVTVGDSDRLKVGEWVLAIGSPFGFDNSATAGIVSAKGRSLPNESYVPFIQTDVAINPGNSGGPLFNLDGQVVGINAQIYSRTGGFMGLSFAVPIDLAMRVAEQLKKTGHVSRGWLGVTIQDVTRDLAESFGMKKPYGALVSEILPNSPAAKSKLQVGDVIVEYDGKRIDQSTDLPPLVGSTPIGERAKLKVIRSGGYRDVYVTIGELPAEEKLAGAENPAPSVATNSILGMTVKDLGPQDKSDHKVDHGVLVEGVGPGPAKTADVRGGDIIVQFDRKPVSSVKQLKKLVADTPRERAVPVLVRRGDGSLFLVFKIPASNK